MAQLYRQAVAKAFNKELDWDSDSLRLTLHTDAYVPDLDAHAYVSSLTGELATGGGYNAGGYTLTASTPTYSTANAFATAFAINTPLLLGTVVRPASGNGWLYCVVTDGTTGGATPGWPTTLGATVTSGTVTFAAVGRGIVVLNHAPVNVSAFTGSFRYAVVSDRTAATAATQPLIAVIDWGAMQTGAGGPLSYTPDPQGLLQFFLP